MEELAQALTRARRDRVPVPPLTAERPEMTAGDAYAMQRRLVELLRPTARRDRRLEARPDSPGDAGAARRRPARLRADAVRGVHPDGGPASTSTADPPRVEAEIAVVLGPRWPAPAAPPECAARPPGRWPRIEIIDSRIADWRIRLADTIADLASCGRHRPVRPPGPPRPARPAAGRGGRHPQRRGRRHRRRRGRPRRPAARGRLGGQHPGPARGDAGGRATWS